MQPSDGRPLRFWGEVVRLLRAAHDDPLAMLPDPEDGLGADFASRLGSGSDQLPAPTLVVLDDFEQAQSRALAEDLDLFLRSRQERLRLVIASRHDPSLSLQRLRLEGRLTELRATDLVMTPDESRELFTRHGLTLTEEQAEVLHERTEGWVAGLSLAALSLRDHPDAGSFIRTFAGDERPVGDYLIEEVLQRQSPQLRDFMLRTSVPEVLEPGLAEALTGAADAMHTLELLARSNTFLTEADEHRRHYRYHPLFRELLLSQLRYELPEAFALEHRRAARWYAAEGRPDKAVWHAMASGSHEMAEELVARQWLTLLLRGHAQQLLRWVRRLGDQAVATKPELAVAAAGAELAAGDLDAAHRYLTLADDQAGRLPAKRRAQFAVSRASVTMLESRLRGDFAATRDAAHKLLNAYQVGGADRELRALAQLNLGIADYWLGDRVAAIRTLEEVLEINRAVSPDGFTCDCLAQLALFAVLDGRLRDGVAFGRSALRIAARRGWDERPVAIAAYLALSIVSFQWAELDESGRLLDRAIAAAQGSRLIVGSLAALFHGLRVGIEDPAHGLRIVHAVGCDLRSLELPDSLGAAAALLEAELAIDAGDLERAQHALEEASVTTILPLEAAVARARIALARAEPAEALAWLEPAELDNSSKVMYLGTRIRALSLSSLAHSLLHEDERALALLEQALALAQPEGYRLPLVSIGAPLRSLLKRRIRAGTAHRSLAGDVIQRLDGEDTADAEFGALVLLDPLSDREEAVLRYLPTVMSKAEIASELFVSVNTVKTHTKNIYRKLDVATRNDAVRRAKQLHLV